MLLTLAPGLRVVRRGPDHLQVGLYDDRRVVLPRTEATAHVLAQVEQGLPVDLERPGVPATVHRLVAAGCVVPQGPGQPSARARRRAQTRVAVAVRGGPDPRPLLRRAGLETFVGRDEPADVGLLVSRGEPEREEIDPWLRRGVPHLVVRLVDAGVVIGPFALPGRAACLRCLDAHRAEADPDHLAVLARYGVASRRARPDGADATEPAVLALALAWAVRDLVAHADGHRPTTVSRTVRLGPGIDREVRTTWAMHPECGCCWPGDPHR